MDTSESVVPASRKSSLNVVGMLASTPVGCTPSTLVSCYMVLMFYQHQSYSC